MTWIEGISFGDAVFEGFSALGTVGLSRDLTPRLSLPSKLLLMSLMFAGRVLYPVLVVAITRSRRPDSGDAGWA